MKKWDVFISHASEDKKSIAKPLAEMLESIGLKVWLDSNELKVGDSLTSKINHGIANSRFGVVILSQSFFKKDWPIKELNSFISTENLNSKKILPIWHKIDKDYILKYSPLLADKLYISTKTDLLEIAYNIGKAIESKENENFYDLPALNETDHEKVIEDIKVVEKNEPDSYILIIEKKKKKIITSISLTFLFLLISVVILSSFVYLFKTTIDKNHDLEVAGSVFLIFSFYYVFFKVMSNFISYLIINANISSGKYNGIVSNDDFLLDNPLLYWFIKGKLGVFIYYAIYFIVVFFIIVSGFAVLISTASLYFENNIYYSFISIIISFGFLIKLILYFVKFLRSKKHL